MEFSYRRFTADGAAFDVHELSSPVSRLQWRVDTGECLWIGVNEAVQGTGIARAMWAQAQAYGPIAHSAQRTREGDGFARAVGGALPKLILL